MKKRNLILIGICLLILISGCKGWYTDETLFIGDICSHNVSIAPTERFCEDIDMEFIEYGVGFGKVWGCIDNNGEIHSYATRSINREYWIVGNKTYDMEWTC